MSGAIKTILCILLCISTSLESMLDKNFVAKPFVNASSQKAAELARNAWTMPLPELVGRLKIFEANHFTQCSHDIVLIGSRQLSDLAVKVSADLGLAMLFFYNNPVHYAEGFRCLKDVAQQNHNFRAQAAAYYYMGLFYLFGFGVLQNVSEAKKMFFQVSRQNYDPALKTNALFFQSLIESSGKNGQLASEEKILLQLGLRYAHGNVAEAVRKWRVQKNETVLVDKQKALKAGMLFHGSLAEAAKNEGVEEALDAIMHYSKPHAQDKQGQSALHFVVTLGYANETAMLLQDGADPNVRNGEGETSLHKAAAGSDTEIVQLLIKAGAVVSVVDNQGNSPLHLAAAFGTPDIIEELIGAGAQINARTLLGKTPLEKARYYNRLEAIRILIEAGANVKAKENLDTFGQLNHKLEVQDENRCTREHRREKAQMNEKLQNAAASVMSEALACQLKKEQEIASKAEQVRKIHLENERRAREHAAKLKEEADCRAAEEKQILVQTKNARIEQTKTFVKDGWDLIYNGGPNTLMDYRHPFTRSNLNTSDFERAFYGRIFNHNLSEGPAFFARILLSFRDSEFNGRMLNKINIMAAALLPNLVEFESEQLLQLERAFNEYESEILDMEAAVKAQSALRGNEMTIPAAYLLRKLASRQAHNRLRINDGSELYYKKALDRALFLGKMAEIRCVFIDS